MTPQLDRATRIKILLLERGLTQAEIARSIGVSRAHVGQVINGQKQNPKLRRQIAKILDLPAEDLWQDRQDKMACA